MEGAEESQLFEGVSRSLIEAIRRAMRVANQNDDGDLEPLSQTELAERSGVSRSTLARYMRTGLEDAAANPTLDMICRLAYTLRVPPAFLMMRPKDWSAIATGLSTFLAALSSPEFEAVLLKLQRMEAPTSPNVAHAAIDLGRLMNTVEDGQDQRLPKEVREFRNAAKASTAAIAASIPFHFDRVSKNHLPVLLCLCSILGTTNTRS